MRMKATILLLIAVTSFFSMVPILYAASQPQVVEIYRTPLKPPPDVSVNVTCSILDKYGLVNVSLYFATNGGLFHNVAMQIIDGDYFNGTFLARIPAQPDATVVEYYIEARDSIGYLAQTPKDGYQVSFDKTPPTVVKVNRVKPVGSPVLPTENVTIEALVTDDGSGVKNVTLFFGVGEDPWGMNFSEVPMTKCHGDDYNCSFVGFIPQYPNGSRVFYFVSVTDNANNTWEEPTRYQYFVTKATNSYLIINIAISSVDMKNLTATVNIKIQALLPSENEPDTLNIWLENGRSSAALADVLPLQVKSSFESQRFFYMDAIACNVHLMGYPGSPNSYPYDSYFLNFTFNIYWSQPNSLQVSSVFFEDNHLRNAWNNPLHYESNTTDNVGRTILVTTIELERDSASVFPIILLIILLFFVLGGTLLVEPTRLNERLTVFLAIFIFVAGFFFSLDSMVPYRYGFTVAEILVLSLVVGSALFTLGSIFSKAVSSYFKSPPDFANIIIDVVFAASLVLVLWSLGVWETEAVPPQHRFLIFAGINYGIVLRAIMTFRKRTRRQTIYNKSLYE